MDGWMEEEGLGRGGLNESNGNNSWSRGGLESIEKRLVVFTGPH